jgi:hypothetical protein
LSSSPAMAGAVMADNGSGEGAMDSLLSTRFPQTRLLGMWWLWRLWWRMGADGRLVVVDR